MNRRRFLKTTAGAAVALAAARRAYGAFAQTIPLQKFVAPLRTLGQMAPATKLYRSTVPGCTTVSSVCIERSLTSAS